MRIFFSFIVGCLQDNYFATQQLKRIEWQRMAIKRQEKQTESVYFASFNYTAIMH
jgi:hypothetical protein